MGKVIGILSLKGGVGKTSSVVALGDAISDFGKKVLLIDGNFSSPNLGLHLKVVEPEITMHHVFNRTFHTKDAICKLGKFDLIPSSLFSNIKINPFELKDKVKHLRKRYDVILIDSSPSLDEETLAVMLASDELLVVTTPDIPTLSTTIKAVKLAKQREAPLRGLILNKVHDKSFELSIKDIEDASEVSVLAVIPYDINFLKSLSEFTPYTNYKSKSRGSTEYRKLAGVLIGEKYNPFSLRRFLRITPKREEINREIYYRNFFK